MNGLTKYTKKKEMNQKGKNYKTNYMKKYLLIFALLLGAVSSWGQSKADQAAVLQKCIDLSALESSYAIDANGQGEQLVVLIPKFAFPTDLAVTKFEKPLRFLDKAAIYDQQLKQVLFIGKFEVGATSASVEIFNYHNFTGTGGSDKASIELAKTGGAWNVVTSNLEKN